MERNKHACRKEIKMDISKVMVEKMDILGQAEYYNKKMRDEAIKGASEEKIKAYDCGVKNTMEVLKMLITHSGDGEKDRIIYQKYGEVSNVVQKRRLSHVLNELEETGQIDLAKED